MSILNERIHERREACGLTLLYVAQKIGVKEATMQRYESGQIKNIKHETILALSEVFKCSPSYLMGWIDTLHEVAPAQDTSIQLPISLHEQMVIAAYRDNPAMQAAIDKLLGLEDTEAAEDIAPSMVKKGAV